MAEHYIYTLYDFPDLNENRSTIKNLKYEIGKRVKGIIEPKIKIIEDESKEVANLMIDHQIERENRVYSALGIKEISRDASEEEKDRIIKEIREKIYGIDNNGEQEGIKNAQECIKLIADFVDEFLVEKSNLIKKDNASKKELEEAVSELINLRQSFIDKYGGLQKIIQDLGQKNFISIDQILKTTEYWNTEIANSKSLKQKKIILFEDNSNKINGNLTVDQLKEIIKAYKNKRNDYFGGIGEAASIFLIKTRTEEITKTFKDGIEQEVKLSLKAETTSRWDSISSQKYQQEYEKTVEKAISELKNNKIVDNIFTIDTSKNLKADEVYTIILKFNEEKIKEKIIQFGVSNKMSGSSRYSLNIQDTSLAAILDNLPKVESSAYSQTKIVRKELTNLLINAASEIAWMHAPIVIGTIKDLIKKVINNYGYIWLTGGLSGGDNGIFSTAHADFFSLYKNGNLYFIPMSIILMDAYKAEGSKNSPFLFKGEFIKKDQLEDSELIILDNQKRNGKADHKKLIDKILGISGESQGIVGKSGSIEIGSYKRLNLG